MKLSALEHQKKTGLLNTEHLKKKNQKPANPVIEAQKPVANQNKNNVLNRPVESKK